MVVALAGCAGDTEQPVDEAPGGSAIVDGPEAGATLDGESAEDPAEVREAGFGQRQPAPGAIHARLDSNEVIRALYVNRWAAQSRNRMLSLVGMVDSSVVNAFVIDMKDEFGLNFESSDSTIQRTAGSSGRIRWLAEMLDTLRANSIMPIARVVVFKDSVASRLNPDETIRTPEGDVWRDENGVAWLSPYSSYAREYNIRVAEEIVRLGFEEVQFDYVRFPEPYQRLATQVFPGSDGVSKPDAIAEFLGAARERLNALGVRSTAAVFGLTTTVNGPLEIGQHWEKLVPVADVLLPMVYPSHYPGGSFGIARPNAEPYEIVKSAITRARERTEALGFGGHRVRPYLQAFTLGQPPYGAEEVAAQIRAVEDSGYQGWVLWHPGSRYGAYFEAIRK